ncbi:MAG: hypothetical protein MZV70_63550 [Desulfobacterales bacterium]|nr:hypothetical protein [Desulfobacterales bacterium]
MLGRRGGRPGRRCGGELWQRLEAEVVEVVEVEVTGEVPAVAGGGFRCPRTTGARP